MTHKLLASDGFGLRSSGKVLRVDRSGKAECSANLPCHSPTTAPSVSSSFARQT